VVTRSIFLPLTLKARAATANFILMQHASTTAGNLLSQIKEQQLSIDADKRPRLPTRWQLSRTYYKYMRNQHRTTSIWWYHANVFMQVGGQRQQWCSQQCTQHQGKLCNSSDQRQQQQVHLPDSGAGVGSVLQGLQLHACDADSRFPVPMQSGQEGAAAGRHPCPAPACYMGHLMMIPWLCP
jgi:hypothetical protein